MTEDELRQEIETAEARIAERGSREQWLWEKVRIEPEQWANPQYDAGDRVWVVALLGNACLYWNPVEEGWGWGEFETAGMVAKPHFEQDSIISSNVLPMLVAGLRSKRAIFVSFIVPTSSLTARCLNLS